MDQFRLQDPLFPEDHMAVAEKIVPKKPKPPNVGQPRKTTAKIAVDVLRKLKMVSTYKGVDLYDFMDEILRDAADREYERMIREEAR